jgi:hypothetical protein
MPFLHPCSASTVGGGGETAVAPGRLQTRGERGGSGGQSAIRRTGEVGRTGTCKTCGATVTSGKRGPKRTVCDGCRKKANGDAARERWRRNHPGWEAGKVKQSEQQTQYLTRKRTGAALPEPQTPEEVVKRMLEPETKKNDALKLAVDVPDSLFVRNRRDDTLEIQESVYTPGPKTFGWRERGLPTRTTWGKAIDPSMPARKLVVKAPARKVTAGSKPIWESQLYPEPLLGSSNSIEDLYVWGPANDGEVDIFKGQRPDVIRSRAPALDAIRAASGDALEALAEKRGEVVPGPEEAKILIRHITGQLEPWQERRFGSVLRKIDLGEIRARDGRPITRRTTPTREPKNLDEALVNLAIREKEARRQ